MSYEFVAKQTLNIDGVRAYNEGDEVPASVVERYKWNDAVVKAETQAGKPTAAALKVKDEVTAPAEYPAAP